MRVHERVRARIARQKPWSFGSTKIDRILGMVVKALAE